MSRSVRIHACSAEHGTEGARSVPRVLRPSYLAVAFAVAAGSAFASSPVAAKPAPKVPYFASISPTSSSVIMQWTRGADDTGGTLDTIGASEGVSFTFYGKNAQPITGLKNLAADFVLNAAAPDGSTNFYVVPPETNNGVTTYEAGMSQISGTFSLIYKGATFTYNGVQYSAGTDLLSGKFANADMTITDKGSASTGYTTIGFDLRVCAGPVCGKPETLNYSSSIVKWGSRAVRDFIFDACTQCDSGLSGFTWPTGPITTTTYEPGQALPDFSVRPGGRFDGYSPNKFPVPEPSAWVLMLLGVGAIGAVARARRKMVDTVDA